MNAFLHRRLALSALLGATLLAAVGCGSMYTLTSEVATYGEWPADRKGGSYAIERLPSQKNSDKRDAIEGAARVALEKAGFTPAADAKAADFVVSIGARSTLTEYSPWEDPLWRHWRSNWRFGPPNRMFYGPFTLRERAYEREVAVLVRERSSGQPVYEARASSDGLSVGDEKVFGAMFQAALSDFPQTKDKPHLVSVTVER
ncbi:DUF4136 domain-containing protein [Pelomonas sp. SE-A7]|uniref:DUF4136 domain-containing protein n=1 Tax=Pelomonas sp. SE-A7 TaxID=3054953 RepID=UPI00259CAE19|nr:DUF4136 domain-containing protein [Pelomonas sp. SE-A7]MDM4767851.1 DUF4136 domain-containing protein [Pelomonas sp. SE-A7]